MSTETMKVVRVHEFGGPEVLRYEDVPRTTPQDDEVLVKMEAAGVNYADTMRRAGRYRETPKFPFIIGIEVCGAVVEVGKQVKDLTAGQRVMGHVSNGYAEYCAVPASYLMPVPDTMSAEEGAAFPVVFQTAYHALKTVARVQPCETVLIHAAAGGVGTAAVQIAKLLGARVFATASADEKLQRVKELGADELINYTQEKFDEVVRERTDGSGADVILESVGGEVFRRSIDCLAPLGRLVVYGMASGNTGSVQAGRLLFESQGVFGLHIGRLRQGRPDVIRVGMIELLGWLAADKIRPIIGHHFPLSEAAEAHRLMESRESFGKIVLVP